MFSCVTSLFDIGWNLGHCFKGACRVRISRIIFVSSAANARDATAFALLKHVWDNCIVNQISLKVGGTFDELRNLTKDTKPASKLIAIVRKAELNHPVSILVGQVVPEQLVVCHSMMLIIDCSNGIYLNQS